MEPLVLTDKSVYPHDDLIFSIIGNNSVYWKELLAAIRERFPESEEVWKYYNDGKSWLLKVSKKTKTIFWCSILKDSFRITFYFTDKAEQAIINSPISDDLKENFIKGKRYNKIRGLTIIFKYKRDIEYAKS